MIFSSAGETVAVHSELPWVRRLVHRAIGEPDTSPARSSSGGPTVRLRVEASRAAFSRDGLRPLTRGAYTDGTRTLLANAGGAGFDLLVTAQEVLDVVARYRPSVPTRAANCLLGSRFGLLAGQVLVHYPVLWRAGWRGRVPLHASVLGTTEGTPLIAGPGGVGKSTVLSKLTTTPGDGPTAATADNLCAADEWRCFGLAEPLRTDAPGERGRRVSHGRVERPLPGRAPVLAPDRLVVLERGARTEITPLEPEEAARVLTTGTYAAGELRRFWAFAATLALATGRGPAHPPIDGVSRRYAERLPCLRVRVGDRDAITAGQLCGRDRLTRETT
jgi:hypothetical protein